MSTELPADSNVRVKVRRKREPAKPPKPATRINTPGKTKENDAFLALRRDWLKIMQEDLAIFKREIMAETSKAPQTLTGLVYSGINALMQDLQPLAKTEKHPDGFDFRRIDNIVAEVQPLLVKHKLLYVADEVISNEQIDRTVLLENNVRYVNIHTRVAIRYRWYSTIDGSSVAVVGIGEGVSEQQFSTNAAFTMAEKAMLCDILAIPVFGEDDPEAAAPERSQGAAPPQHFTEPAAMKQPDVNQVSLFDTADPQATAPPETKKRRSKKDDGQVVTAGTGEAAPNMEEVAQHTPLSAGMIKIIQTNLKSAGKTEEQLCEQFKVDSLADMSAGQMGAILAWVKS